MSNVNGIYKKINNIMKKVEFVTKDGQLGYGQNTFTIVTHDKVLSVVRQHFVEEGVIVVPKQVDKGVSIEGTTKNGGKKIRMEALYDVSFIDVDELKFFEVSEDMPEKIINACKKSSQSIPSNIGDISRCVYESLVMKFKLNLKLLEDVINTKIEVIHLIGGGVNNIYFCQLRYEHIEPYQNYQIRVIRLYHELL